MTLNGDQRKRLERAIESARNYQRIYGRRSVGGTARDIQVLLVLAAAGPASASEVGRALGRDRAAITRALERLRSRRLVRQVKSKGRRQPHELSAAGGRTVQTFLAELN